MGASSEMWLHHQEQLNVATDIAVRAGVLVRCPYHGTVYDALSGDNTPAYKLGNYLLSKGELAKSFTNSREMTDAIKSAVEDSGMICGWCDKFEAE